MLRPIILAISIVVSGCSTTDTVKQPTDFSIYENHARSVASVDQWEIKGRISVRRGTKGEIGRLFWKRDGDAHKMELYGSFGSRRIRILQDSEGAVLKDTEGKTVVGASIKEVLEERTGWMLPVHELFDWVVGRPYSGSPSVKTWDIDGRLIILDQAGWTVVFSNYQEFDSFALPTRFRITANHVNADSDSQASEIRLAISDWGVQ